MKLADYAREVIRQEAGSVAAMAERLNDSFDLAAEAIMNCQGRVIVSGMGKSGLVGKKIAATFNSTGISSFFLHPAEALHGDLGLIRAEDILLVISKSGTLQEMETIIAAARRMGVTIIGLCGAMNSPLAERSDIVLDCSVEAEAGPNNLVPTSSSTAALVMGDALAVVLLKARDFTADDFAVLHPGGFLGRRLLRRVSEVHHTGDELPLVSADTSMSQTLVMMTSKRLGCVVVRNDQGRTAGIFTDGDLRRLVERQPDFLSMTASEAMVKDPKTISQDAILDAALAVMEKYSITQLPTVDSDGKLVGIIHLHDLLRSKLV
jgi:arabinose-5-phosphate isomerase